MTTRKQLIQRHVGFFRASHSHKLVRVLSLVVFLVMIVFIQYIRLPYELTTISTTTTTSTTTTSSSLSQYDQFCLTLARQISAEPAFRIPHNLTSRHRPIPYSYKHWKSSPLLPRPINQCEHAIFIRLLSLLIEHAFVKHNISYMMMAGTLIGSYTFHDILPWDDDVDLSVGIKDRQRFQTIIRSEIFSSQSIRLMQMQNARDYDKVYFTWCPYAGVLPWRFPFIDIFYHGENSTHVWLIGKPSSCPVRRENVFPLTLRPLGPLWVSAPREPIAHFESRGLDRIGCYSIAYSHKYERLVYNITQYANCVDLIPFYPFVERQCTSTKCMEHLKLGNKSLQTITFTPAYRTFFYKEKNPSYVAC